MDYLYHYKNPNLKQLCQKVDVTPQTLKLELQNLRELFDTFKIKVSIKKNGDFFITGSKERFIELIWEAKNCLEFSIENKILLLLIVADDFLTLQEIADSLFMSKSYIEKQMPEVLKKYKDKVVTVRHYGIKYDAPQFDRRTDFVKLLFPYISGINFADEIKNFSKLHFPIMEYMNGIYIEKAENLIKEIQGRCGSNFADIWLRQFFLVVFFTIWNIDKKNPEYINEGYFDQAIVSQSLKGYMDMLQLVNERCNLNLVDKEIRYLSYYIIISMRNEGVVLETLENEVKQFVNEILEEIQKQYSINLFHDEEFVKRLSIHIYMLVLRGSKISVETNWSGLNLRKQYPFGFELAVLAADVISNHTGRRLNNCEIDYLLLHFQIALEHLKKKSRKINTIIICHYGTAAAELISTKVRRKFSEIQIIRILSLQQYLESKEKDYELILSTEKIPDTDKEVIYVDAVLQEYELERIAQFVEQECTGNMLMMKLHEAEVVPIDEYDTREQIISGMTDLLIERHYVTKGYKESVLKREELSSTNMNHIAIPHGDPCFVKDTKLLIGRRKEPILWGDSYVNLVFIFAFSKAMIIENAHIFSDFYRKIATPGVEEKIAQMSELEDNDFKKMVVKICMD